jgi:hypothetical protein
VKKDYQFQFLSNQRFTETDLDIYKQSLTETAAKISRTTTGPTPTSVPALPNPKNSPISCNAPAQTPSRASPPNPKLPPPASPNLTKRHASSKPSA